MLGKFNQFYDKTRTYLKYHTMGETAHWLYHRVISRINKQFASPMGMSAVSVSAYAAQERKYRDAGLAGVEWPDYRKYLLTAEDTAACTMKQGRSVFIFAKAPYYAITPDRRSMALTDACNKMGFAVHYFYLSQPTGFEKQTYTPTPCVSHMPVSALDEAYYTSLVQAGDLVLFDGADPSTQPYAAISKTLGAKQVLFWNTSSEIPAAQFLSQCDLLISTDKTSAEMLQAAACVPVMSMNDGVDDEIFARKLEYPVPADLVQGSKTLVYYGKLAADYVDYALLFAVAKSRPDFAINLIGSDRPHFTQAVPANIHFLGGKKTSHLPAYLKHADAALLPLHKGAAPLQLFEYIAMGKPVVSTVVLESSDCPNLFHGTDTESWLQLLSDDLEINLSAAEGFTLENTWGKRIESIMDHTYPDLAPRCAENYYGKLSIVVLNYNNKGIIDKCVDSLLRCGDRYGYQVVVVDNQSKDGSYEQLQARFGDRITLVRNSKNGCSSGRNLGVANAKGDYILFLDSDQWATNRYWLDAYLHICSTADRFGSVAWNGGWFDKYAAGYMIVDNYAFRCMPPSASYRGDIGYLATCGFLMSKELFHEIQGFDEYYDPTCYEDTDLSLKIRHAGLETYYSPCLGVVHLPHQTTKAGTESHLKRITEKQRYFAAKWRKLNPALLNYIREH